MNKNIVDFVRESNAIEQIFREPTENEINELVRFIALKKITIEDIEIFISVYEPKAILRDKYDLNVRVKSKEGVYIPPFSGPHIREELFELLNSNYTPYETHIKYEKIHPFTDCNGRSGRALWAWMVKDLSDGFLLRFYFQSLRESL